ncbi:migration and invasion-inhibitory protein [Echinops telfairi]|uniref:Migration and invasion-inhibitory protein n=2 Tax=Echinops telfairi TaxID=9371 RepID=A0AC55DT82_ECHTE|nr:migration and invasion-inhibitory protein [Echinops telfairi]XP_045154954.1 migration and invasion-inhibitory protein [Echinops telfairi]
MVDTQDLVQLRRLNLELLGRLWARQDAVRQSVAEAASESSLDSSSSQDTEMLPSQRMTSTTSRPSSSPGHPTDGPCDLAWPGRTSSLAVSFPPPVCHRPKPLDRVRPHSAPCLVTSGVSDLGPGGPGSQDTSLCRPTPPQKSSKPRVTFSKEPEVPEWSWRLRPYLGYDWIAGTLDSASLVTDKSDTFFSKLQEFREANKEECISSEPEPQLLSLRDSSHMVEDHECVYSYRINRRLFLVPADPGTPCRLCRTPRNQRDLETLADPARVRVSLPLSVLEPPHSYHIHRRKSFDASDTLALPRHCLLGWDIIPPRPEKSSLPRNLDLWSCVSSEAQHRKPSASSPAHLALPTRAPPPAPTWLEPQGTGPHTPRQKP